MVMIVGAICFLTSKKHEHPSNSKVLIMPSSLLITYIDNVPKDLLLDNLSALNFVPRVPSFPTSLMYLHALRAHAPYCLRAFVRLLLMCFHFFTTFLRVFIFFTCLECLHFFAYLHYFTCLYFYAPCVPSFFYVPYVPSFFHVLYVPSTFYVP